MIRSRLIGLVIAALVLCHLVASHLVGCAEKRPSVPITPFADILRDSLGFFTSSTDPQGKYIRYVFEWGDGTFDTTSFFSSGDTVGCCHVYPDSGSYTIRARAVNERGAESDWSEPSLFHWSQPPQVLDTILGPGWWGTERWCRFTVTVADADGDSISARFGWGNGTKSDWSSFVASGGSITDSVFYRAPGQCTVRVVLRDKGNTVAPGKAKPVKVSTMAVLWRAQHGDECYWTTPALGVIDGQLFVFAVADEQILRCFSSDGELVWFTYLPDYCVYGPCLSSDCSRIYVTGFSQMALCCLDARSGALVWELRCVDWADCTPAVGPGGEIYLATGEDPGALFKVIDCGDSARVEWSLEISNVRSGVAIGREGTVYVACDEERGPYYSLLAVSPDGAVLWRDTSHIDPTGGDPVPPVIDEQGRVIVGDWSGGVYCFNPDGTLGWQRSLENLYPGSLAVGHEGRTYLHDEGYLSCLDREGELLWQTVVPEEVDIFTHTPCVAADSTVVLCGPERPAIAGLGFDGTLRWEFYPYDSLCGGPPEARFGPGEGSVRPARRGKDEGDEDPSPVIGPDGNIYFGGGSGLFCVSYGRNRLANTAWPTYFHDPAHSGWAGRQ